MQHETWRFFAIICAASLNSKAFAVTPTPRQLTGEVSPSCAASTCIIAKPLRGRRRGKSSSKNSNCCNIHKQQTHTHTETEMLVASMQRELMAKCAQLKMRSIKSLHLEKPLARASCYTF